ncbi:MAG: polyphosphate kinase 1 [Opitutales bacterium]|jgi:polyphosphate kinase|nr:polyphosphate kinase 1 [Opitutales bacterium]MDP4659281.1 polyphosphate kinase 1 [Opitutales bacterium]MDP4774830.1 polyphosphate kinase 1 [Opitutales bacterium]MDP4787202.1 polyphosphate kinase 1 [Opitutales bacterium]MDP4860757.1 polyphosphate kinase 1 [Opitutales bacterium]
MFNRELSWLSFDRRVLELAEDESIPLLERVRFLSIVSSNLDEFFEIRVAGIMQQEESASHPATKEFLAELLDRARTLVDDQQRCWRQKLLPALSAQGIEVLAREQLGDLARGELSPRFDRDILPALTPLAIDPSHPFPVLTNKGLYVLALLRDPASGEMRRAVVPVPRILPRILALSGRKSFTFLSHVIQLFLHRLFPGLELQGSWAFRITRNSDLYVDEEEAVNLLEAIEDEIRNLRKGAPVRLEIEADVPAGEMQWLLDSIGLTADNAFLIPGPVNMLRLGSLIEMIGRPELLYPNFVSVTPAECAEPAKLFERIAEQDIVLHHPYESFTPVVDFIRQAAKDENVVAIKLTLYRTSGDSPVVEALKEAARNGKQVTALVELRARFDELNNIEWARQLEEAGAHVVYGLAGLKTHCKACLVVRQEKDGLRRYAHLGTGNYNPKTARIYTDFSLLTRDEEITADVGLLFNVLTGNLAGPKFRHLLVAPFDLARRIVELIDAEASAAKAGRKATIFAKVNSLVDPEVIAALYRASVAGVKVELVVRGICCLVPGKPGLSENIRVRSFLGRFLEHSRLFRFENAEAEPIILMGSADWMPRNFQRRIECVFPLRAPHVRRRIEEEVMRVYQDRQGDAKSLGPDGSYAACEPMGRLAPGAQDTFLQLAAKAAQARVTEQPQN